MYKLLGVFAITFFSFWSLPAHAISLSPSISEVSALPGQEETKKEKAKQYMLWGIIGLTVMVSVWGLVNILGDTFDIVDPTPPSIPAMPHY
jgi:hypothetical protein